MVLNNVQSVQKVLFQSIPMKVMFHLQENKAETTHKTSAAQCISDTAEWDH